MPEAAAAALTSHSCWEPACARDAARAPLGPLLLLPVLPVLAVLLALLLGGWRWPECGGEWGPRRGCWCWCW